MEDSGRDPIALGKSAIVALFVWLACDILLGFASGYELLTLSALDPSTEMTMSSSPPEAALSDMAVALVGLTYMLAFAVAGFLILRWIYRVNKNAHVLTAWMQMSPGWNVGFFFIPIATLWKPFEGVRQSWQASFSPDDPDAEPVPDLLRWWWGLWVATSILSNISFRLSLKVETVSDQLPVDVINMVSLLIDIPLAFFLAAMIRKLSAAQSGMLKRAVFA
jgi:hypothetical protein